MHQRFSAQHGAVLTPLIASFICNSQAAHRTKQFGIPDGADCRPSLNDAATTPQAGWANHSMTLSRFFCSCNGS